MLQVRPKWRISPIHKGDTPLLARDGGWRLESTMVNRGIDHIDNLSIGGKCNDSSTGKRLGGERPGNRATIEVNRGIVENDFSENQNRSLASRHDLGDSNAAEFLHLRTGGFCVIMGASPQTQEAAECGLTTPTRCRIL